MIFNEKKYSLDCVKGINKNYFITGSENGELALWNVTKKKPRIVIKNAH